MVASNLEEPACRPDSGEEKLAELRQMIEHAAHLLPTQGPINVFVHHNTLHGFEHLDFDTGVQAGGRIYGCEPYLPEERYREKLARGRIRFEDLEAVLQFDLGDEADRLVSVFCTRYSLRLSMLRFALQTGSVHEVRWAMAETDALRHFRPDVAPEVQRQLILGTRRVVQNGSGTRQGASVLAEVLRGFHDRAPDNWSDQDWESFVLNYLWRVCCEGVRKCGESTSVEGSSAASVRSPDVESQRARVGFSRVVEDTLIRFTSAFLDQGLADWSLPDRQLGFFQAFLKLYSGSPMVTPWLGKLRRECQRVLQLGIGPLETIAESLKLLGVDEGNQEDFLAGTLLALRGWAGMIWQMETNAEWAPHPAPRGCLVDFVAVCLMLQRLAGRQTSREDKNAEQRFVDATASEPAAGRPTHHDSVEMRAYTVFQLAQLLGWRPHDLELLDEPLWKALSQEIDSFPSIERRRIFQRALERKYRHELFDAIIAHNHRLHSQEGSVRGRAPSGSASQFQFVACIDEREESFRRHLEEVAPQCETFGIAGFFGVAMYYRGLEEAHFRPLCPVNIKPIHYVIETPTYSAVEQARRRSDARRRIGHATHQAHRGTRTVLGGIVTGLLGSFAAIPLVTRVFFPRATARIRRSFGSMVHTSATELRLERLEREPGSTGGHIGFSVQEMADTVEQQLRAMGLNHPDLFSRLVIICGHGSSSLNNPHEAAHDCGACGGGRGGPNARAFAQMANDRRVRAMLEQRGLTIPDSTYFLGAFHNTCNDDVSWYDLDRIPLSHRELFEQARRCVDQARKRNAHERCRRFESADLSLNFDDALRHVESRAEDLSQTRPEYGHATNAICLIGRRQWSRGLFLDRRAFLVSYDPARDDEQRSVLQRTLLAAIPVCAGINLEYYFSYVDPTGYGCGTKLPHNITSLLGVMDGAASDLRPGLPWQMVEIHEPMRLLFVIETEPDALTRIIESNRSIARLIEHEWVQVALFDAATRRITRYVRGAFQPYTPERGELPRVASSFDWYQGQREHLGFASIDASSPAANGAGE